MSRSYFSNIEHAAHNTTFSLRDVIEQLNFNEQGLIPVIAQDYATKNVLMQAWMNREALEKTLACGRMVYWSRSRQCFWEKGATSGHTQALIDMAFDCDGDVILCQVEQIGAACHTGRPACFYLKVDAALKQVRIEGDASA